MSRRTCAGGCHSEEHRDEESAFVLSSRAEPDHYVLQMIRKSRDLALRIAILSEGKKHTRSDENVFTQSKGVRTVYHF
jgi:hypothetical protein